jgi:hypothetical protein
MQDEELQERPARENRAGILVMTLFAGLVFLILPVTLSALEHYVFGTNRFEHLLRKLGLIRFYQWTLDLLSWVLYRLR